jgi:hypothetical protein
MKPKKGEKVPVEGEKANKEIDPETTSFRASEAEVKKAQDQQTHEQTLEAHLEKDSSPKPREANIPSTFSTEDPKREIKLQYAKRKTKGTTHVTEEIAVAETSVAAKIQKTTPTFSKPSIPDPSDQDKPQESQNRDEQATPEEREKKLLLEKRALQEDLAWDLVNELGVKDD